MIPWFCELLFQCIFTPFSCCGHPNYGCPTYGANGACGEGGWLLQSCSCTWIWPSALSSSPTSFWDLNFHCGMYSPQGRSAERQYILSPGMLNFACCTWGWHQLAFLSHKNYSWVPGLKNSAAVPGLERCTAEPCRTAGQSCQGSGVPQAPAWISLNWVCTAGETQRERLCMQWWHSVYVSLRKCFLWWPWREAEFPGCWDAWSCFLPAVWLSCWVQQHHILRWCRETCTSAWTSNVTPG